MKPLGNIFMCTWFSGTVQHDQFSRSLLGKHALQEILNISQPLCFRSVIWKRMHRIWRFSWRALTVTTKNPWRRWVTVYNLFSFARIRYTTNKQTNKWQSKTKEIQNGTAHCRVSTTAFANYSRQLEIINKDLIKLKAMPRFNINRLCAENTKLNKRWS